MTDREKKLAGAVAAAGVLWGLLGGLERYRTAVDANESQAVAAATALEDAEFDVARGELAAERVAAWAKRSLPTDRDVAKSLYQDWVRQQLSAAGLAIEQLSDKTLNRTTPHYAELSLEARASGTLEQLSAFLYQFYAAPHLHRIGAATITAADNGAKLNVVLGIDAMILPESTQTEELSKAEGPKLALSEDEFRTSLTSRNLFAPHAPAAVAADAGEAGAARISGLVSDGAGGYHLWISTENPNRTRKFKKGDEVKFGSFTGKLVDLDARHAVFETDKGQVEVRLDQTLSEAKPVEAAAS